MANQNNTTEVNPFIQEISDNLNMFIENINCLCETFGYSEGMLNRRTRIFPWLTSTDPHDCISKGKTSHPYILQTL